MIVQLAPYSETFGRWDEANGFFLEKLLAEHTVAGGGNSHTVEEGVKITGFMHHFFKRHTTTTKDVHITAAVFYYFSVEIGDEIIVLQLVVPVEKLFSFFLTHAVRVVVFYRWKGTHVLLVSHSIEEMRKVTLLQLCQTKSLFDRAFKGIGRKCRESRSLMLAASSSIDMIFALLRINFGRRN